MSDMEKWKKRQRISEQMLWVACLIQREIFNSHDHRMELENKYYTLKSMLDDIQ